MKKLLLSALVFLTLAGACATAVTNPNITKSFGNVVPAPIFEKVGMVLMKVYLEDAVRDYAEGWLGREEAPISLKGVNTKVRKQIFQGLLDRDDLMEAAEEMSWETYEAWRKVTLEVARTYLRNPQRLQSLYVFLKPTIVEALRSAPHNLGPRVRFYLEDTALLYFQEDSDPRSLRLMVEHQRAEQAWEKMQTTYFGDGLEERAYNDMEAATKAFRASTKDPDALEWARRRHSEGGKDLVRAWGAILADLTNSI